MPKPGRDLTSKAIFPRILGATSTSTSSPASITPVSTTSYPWDPTDAWVETMISPTGRQHGKNAEAGPEGKYTLRRGAAFTLVELILVMAMLVIIIAVSAPSLSKFFRGRVLDSEARRLLSLTRY